MFPTKKVFSKTFLFFCTLFFLVHSKAFAQPTLPDLAAVSQNGMNILTWECQYAGVKTIIVERSSDSIFNFVTIGYVKDLPKGVQYFIDGHAKPGTNWYRLKIIFGSDLNWTSNRLKIVMDSAQIAQARVLPGNDSLQYMVAKFKTRTLNFPDSALTNSSVKTYSGRTRFVTSGKSNTDSASKKGISLEIPDIEQVNAYTYIRSHYVFTNPFTGHINIEVPDVLSHKYSLKFFNSTNQAIIEIEHLSAPKIILDKRNFQKTGMYRFELFKDKEKLETGYVTVY